MEAIFSKKSCKKVSVAILKAKNRLYSIKKETVENLVLSTISFWSG
jgi:hypothetical protein